MRGVGQTTNLIYNLPNERCMLVTKHGTNKLIEGLIKEIRGKEFSKNVKIISISTMSDINKLMGYSHLIFFDHAFFESVEEDIARKALDCARGAATVYHHQKGNFK